MTAHRDPERLIHDFVLEGAEHLHDQVYDAVRAEIEQRRQRVFVGPWRMPDMSKIVPLGLGAAAVVVALVVGAQWLAPPASPGVGGVPSPSPSPSPSPRPSPSPEAGLPLGPFEVVDPAAPEGTPSMTVTIPASGWDYDSQFALLHKGVEVANLPEAALLLWAWPAGTAFYVPADPCRADSTRPETPATTVDEFASALAAQASRDASEPVDVMIGGYAGKSVTLLSPEGVVFEDCELGELVTYGTEQDPLGRYQQGPGQIDELWILEVDGSTVVLDASYRPDTPAELIEELRAIAESTTFE